MVGSHSRLASVFCLLLALAALLLAAGAQKSLESTGGDLAHFSDHALASSGSLPHQRVADQASNGILRESSRQDAMEGRKPVPSKRSSLGSSSTRYVTRFGPICDVDSLTAELTLHLLSSFPQNLVR